MSRVRASFSKLFTLLTGTSVFYNLDIDEVPVVKVNDDESLLSYWPSEDYNSPHGTTPECRFWNFSVQYDAELCSHFTISRTSSTPSRAHDRAMACAASYGTECILSPEVGLALPATFLHESDDRGMRMVMLLGPRLLPLEDPQHQQEQHVRVSPPSGDGIVGTKTFVFRTRIRVEYLDGATRRMVTRELHNTDAYCVQLLRAAFEARCWENLD